MVRVVLRVVAVAHAVVVAWCLFACAVILAESLTGDPRRGPHELPPIIPIVAIVIVLLWLALAVFLCYRAFARRR